MNATPCAAQLEAQQATSALEIGAPFRVGDRAILFDTPVRIVGPFGLYKVAGQGPRMGYAVLDEESGPSREFALAGELRAADGSIAHLRTVRTQGQVAA